MDADKNDPAFSLSIPEGYTVEPLEDGRLAIYCASSGMWLGNFSPSLSIAQEVVKDLIDVHEEEEGRKKVLSDLLIDPPVAKDAGEIKADTGSGTDQTSGVSSGDPPLIAEDTVDTTADTTGADALRIRELEIVADLAVKALRGAGDEATAEVVRQVLEKES